MLTLISVKTDASGLPQLKQSLFQTGIIKKVIQTILKMTVAEQYK